MRQLGKDAQYEMRKGFRDKLRGKFLFRKLDEGVVKIKRERKSKNEEGTRRG